MLFVKRGWLIERGNFSMVEIRFLQPSPCSKGFLPKNTTTVRCSQYNFFLHFFSFCLRSFGPTLDLCWRRLSHAIYALSFTNVKNPKYYLFIQHRVFGFLESKKKRWKIVQCLPKPPHPPFIKRDRFTKIVWRRGTSFFTWIGG